MRKFGITIFAATLLFSFSNIAFSAQSTTRLSHRRIPGTLSITAAPSTSFGESTFNFEGELTSYSELGALTVSDTRGNRAGWTLNLTASDWVNENGDRMDYDGDGATTGKFFFFAPTLANVTSLAGQNTTGLLGGTDSSFSSTTSVINVLTAPGTKGGGRYSISGMRARQYIPPEQAVGTYETTLTYTLS